MTNGNGRTNFLSNDDMVAVIKEIANELDGTQNTLWTPEQAYKQLERSIRNGDWWGALGFLFTCIEIVEIEDPNLARKVVFAHLESYEELRKNHNHPPTPLQQKLMEMLNW